MFSKYLYKLDKNTVSYMIDELQEALRRLAKLEKDNQRLQEDTGIGHCT